MTVRTAFPASAYRRISASAETVVVHVDGIRVEADVGDSVAAVQLLCGKSASQVNRPTGQIRGPYCLMGVCFECLVTVDGIPDRQSCMIAVRDGMQIETQLHDVSETAS